MPRLTIKHGDSFAVFGPRGDIEPAGPDGQGVYHRGTRRLSQWQWCFAPEEPVVLAAGLEDSAPVLRTHLASSDGGLHVRHRAFLWQGTLYGALRLDRFSPAATELDLAARFAADFADVFEVRGFERLRRGQAWSEVDPESVTLGYSGLDGVDRRTRVAFSPPPHAIADDRVRFLLCPEPDRPAELLYTVAFDGEAVAPTEAAFAAALGQLQAQSASRPIGLHSGDRQFDRWVARSAADLRMLETATPHGPYPYAGVPWFSTLFGRDGILTALSCLWLDPAPARAVLLTLAETQADGVDPARHAEPGRILHERRDGEMGALGEIPYACTYASADATPLFLMLASAYWRRTADRPLLERLWPHLERALAWIDGWGDRDGDGFVEYGHAGPQTAADRDWKQGLFNQGWKDSEDAVMHADGSLAEGPIALAEVQAYVYAGKLGAADVAESLGLAGRAATLRAEAAELQARFEQAFWMEDRGTYALALDGAKRPCRVLASNVGHVLFSGIASPDRARRVADALTGPALFTGWGLRTLAAGERLYNPMAYHNGAVWPHDTAIAAAGLARYGLTAEAGRLMDGLFAAATALGRLPELFCGFARQPEEPPIPCPVSCSPQAWAAASVFLLLQAVLGLEVSAEPPALRFHSPALPAPLGRLVLEGLTVAGETVDVIIEPGPHGLDVHLANDRPIGVEVTPRSAALPRRNAPL